jgi:hypothetical protein
MTLLTSSPIPANSEPSQLAELPEDHRSKRLKTSRQAWESEDGTDEDILDRFLKVKQFADHRIASFESKLDSHHLQ